jgi:hypothetical protein
MKSSSRAYLIRRRESYPDLLARDAELVTETTDIAGGDSLRSYLTGRTDIQTED